MAEIDRLGRLGQLVEERAEQMLTHVADLLAPVNLSRASYYNVRDGKTVRPLTYRKIEVALEWERGSIQRYLAGGPEPTPATTKLAPVPALKPVDVDAVVEAVKGSDLMPKAKEHLINQVHLLAMLPLELETPDIVVARKRRQSDKRHEL